MHLALETGADVGINVQSCGHFVHIDCQQAYFQSLQVFIFLFFKNVKLTTIKVLKLLLPSPIKEDLLKFMSEVGRQYYTNII